MAALVAGWRRVSSADAHSTGSTASGGALGDAEPFLVPGATGTNSEPDKTLCSVSATLGSVDAHFKSSAVARPAGIAGAQKELGRLHAACSSLAKTQSSEPLSELPTIIDDLTDALGRAEADALVALGTSPAAEAHNAAKLLLTTLELGVAAIRSARRRAERCEQVVAQYEPWAQGQPDPTELEDLKKAARPAERAFSIANEDLEDANFSHGETSVAAQEAGAKARQAKTRLARARRERDQLARRLAVLKRDHFPELELKISAGAKANLSLIRLPGLVSDQFDLDRGCASKVPISSANESTHTAHKAQLPGGALAALKRCEFDKGPKAATTSRREAGSLHRLRHPRVVELEKVYMGKSGLRAFIQMPLYSAGALNKWIRAADRSPELIRAVLRQLSQAAAHLHGHHVIHSDIHPTNVLMRQPKIGPNESWALKLGDFDVSLDLATRASASHTQGATRIGGRDARAPPELRPPRSERATPASGMYAAGMLLKDVVAMAPGAQSEGFAALATALVAGGHAARPAAVDALQHDLFLGEQARAKDELERPRAELSSALELLETKRPSLRGKESKLRGESVALAATRAELQRQPRQLAAPGAKTTQEKDAADRDRARIAAKLQDANARETTLVTQAQKLEAGSKRLQDERRSVALLLKSSKSPSCWPHKSLAAPHPRYGVERAGCMKAKLQQLLRDTILPGRGGGCKGRPSLSSATVTKVERAENTPLWEAYCCKRAEMAQLAGMPRGAAPMIQIPQRSDLYTALDSSINEARLSHGAKPGAAKLISRRGFDERLANLDGLYGAGAYFAESSCKSMQCAGSPNRNGEHTFICSRVILGHAHKTSQKNRAGWRRAPGRQPGLPRDSALAPGGSQAHREFIVYDGAQAHPELIAHFKV